ncbi:MAG: glycosyltransferase family 39 protein [Desulfobaccales bacterium]
MAFYRDLIDNYLWEILLELRISYYDFKKSIINYINLLVLDRKTELVSLGFIFIVGIFLKVYFLFAPIRMDEAGIFVLLASKSLTVNIFSYPFPGHHVFYTIMVNILHNIFGDNAWVMRLPALLAGILLVPATYLLFRTISNPFTAILSSALVTVSSPLIEYSTTARGYSIVNFIFIISLLLIYYLSENRNTFGWLLFILLSSIGFYTITVFLFPFGISILCYTLLITFRRSNYVYLKDVGLAVLITILFTFILYSPIIMIYGTGVLSSNEVLTSMPLMAFINGLGGMVRFSWAYWNREVPPIIIYIVAFGFIILLARIKYANKELQALLLSSLLWIMTLLFIMRLHPLPRVWLFLIPIYLGLACTGLSYAVEKITRHSLALSIIFSMLFLTSIGSNMVLSDIIYHTDTAGQLLVDGEKIAQYLKDHVRLKDDNIFVAQTTYSSQMRYYFKKYNLPSDQLTRWNSMDDKEFVKNLKKLIIIDVASDPTLSSLPYFYFSEPKEKVLKDAKVNVNDFQSPVLLKKFTTVSLYLYQRK